jgi:hypothetical protein
MLLEGKFLLEKSLSDRVAAAKTAIPDHGPPIQLQEEFNRLSALA